MRIMIVFAALGILTLALFTTPANTWIYQNSTPEDKKYEKFGPRADRLLIKLYPNETAEWDALARGEIDMTDWPLSKPYFDLFTSGWINPATGQPYNETINTVSYGAEFGLYILDLNNNNNEFLGNPPNPAYPNPVYPNPCSVKEFRQAIAHLVDRNQLDTIIGKGFYVPLYTLVLPSMGAYCHPEIRLGGALENLTYPYSRGAAEALLDANGFPINASTGWRFWDRNHNSIEDHGEYLELRFFIRYDCRDRFSFGRYVTDELNAVKVRVKSIYNIVSPPLFDPMGKKDFHLFIGGWSLGIDPDHLILWNWDYYWHPGRCYNYAGCNSVLFNEYSYGVMDAETLDKAKTNAWLAQEVFAGEVLSVPLWSGAGSKPMNRIYTGGNTWLPVSPDDGENMLRGRCWEGVTNRQGYGIDEFHTFLDMHPAGIERGDGENMTIRWGFKTTEIKSFNPIYADRPWDWDVLGLIYESLLTRNPFNSAEIIPWLAESFEVSTYNNPYYGELHSKIKFTIRADATWHDGTPITTADVYFTFVELPRILKARVPSPIWWNWDEPTVDLKILDPYNFEALFFVKSVFLAVSMSSVVILPKHIWKPIAESAPIDVLTGPEPDPNMIGSGPWRLKEYVASSHVLLVSNRVGRSVQTNSGGSTPITSPIGYWRYAPVVLESRVDGTTRGKIGYYGPGAFGWMPLPPPQPHNVSFTVANQYLNRPITINIYQTITYFNDTKIETTIPSINLNALGQPGYNWTWTFTSILKGRIRIDVRIHIPAEDVWFNSTRLLWGTVKEDIVGSTFYDDIGLGTYPFKSQLPSPDFKVNIRDLSTVSRAFGTYLGHSRWNPVCDMNDDYKINIRDIALVARRFGWIGAP